MNILKTRKLFESWVKTQVKNGEVLFRHCTFNEDGYDDETMNSMWTGFCAGFMLARN